MQRKMIRWATRLLTKKKGKGKLREREREKDPNRFAKKNKSKFWLVYTCKKLKSCKITSD